MKGMVIKVGLFDIGLGLISGLAESSGASIGKIPLKEAKSSAPNEMGCYKIYCDGGLKYVGKAEDGIRKRFVQYYNGTTAHYPSAKKIYENRDRIKVSWVICKTREQCRSLENQWISQYNPEWNCQSGWKNY